MFYVRENKTTGLFEVLYANRVFLAFRKQADAQKQADALNGNTA